MTRKVIIFTLSALIVVGAAWAGSVHDRLAPTRTPIIGPHSDLPESAGPVATPRVQPRTLDVVGSQYQAGTTYYDYQHNGTAGKMIDVDEMGMVHLVWMNGLNESNSDRHVYYNVWDPSMMDFLFTAESGGVQVDNSGRAGYTSQVTKSDGFCFPAFHAERPGSPGIFSTAAAIDFLPQSGAFTTFYPNDVAGYEVIWPKVAMDRTGVLHMVSTNNTDNAGDPQDIWYSRGTPEFDQFGFGVGIEYAELTGGEHFESIETVMVIAPDVAASPVSDRVAIGWAHSRDIHIHQDPDPTQLNNDFLVMISEDGGINWGEPINVTDFYLPDYDCVSGDTNECNRDTLRLYTDLSLLFDDTDVLHAAFTVRTMYGVGVPESGLEAPIFWRHWSGIFHWSDAYEEFSPIVNDYNFMTMNEGEALLEEGGWQLNVQRPSLCFDNVTGRLYCSYQKYDSAQYSENLFMSGDAWVSVSCDGGRSWTIGTNVSETVTPPDAPAGQSMSERDITISRNVSYADDVGYINMEYVLDTDCGGWPQEEGAATLCPVFYQRIPVDSIAVDEILDPLWPPLHYDSLGLPGRLIPLEEGNPCLLAADPEDGSLVPSSFALYQNYPNPFNPSTTIQFDLTRNASVNLAVFNVLGQEVATLVDGKPLTAGVHTIDFTASGLSSGVYIYRLEVDGVSATRKMVLMK